MPLASMRDSERNEQLGDAWARAQSYSGDTSVPSLRQMCRSDDPDTRILGLVLMRLRIYSAELLTDYFDIARQLVEDQNNTCRWQSIIVIGEFIESDPESVWEVASHYGVSDDEEMRTAVATVLLEHLLEYYFDTYFPRVRSLVQGGSSNLADTLSRCYPFGDAKSRWDEVKAVLAETPHAG